jgi:hypothetical protein
MRIDLGATYDIDAIMLNDINFSYTRILGNSTYLSTDWSGASFNSGDIAISSDEVVDRYKVYIPLTGFNYRYLAIATPAISNAVGDYTTSWEVGSVILMQTVDELTIKTEYGYTRWATRRSEDSESIYGGIERLLLSDNLAWHGEVVFGIRRESDESECWDLNNYDPAKPMIFYENNNDTSKVYLCVRDNNYEGTQIFKDHVEGNTIQFEELI